MLIKINNKPVTVTEEDDKSSLSIPYICVSTLGYTLIFWFLDYVCYTFFFVHPFPWITFVGKIISFIGGLL